MDIWLMETLLCFRLTALEPIFSPFLLLYFLNSIVDKAMKQVRTILANTRNPRLAENEEHVYDDKYALVEFLTNTSVAAQMNALERLGLDPDKFRTVSGWVHDGRKTVTLRFKAKDTCSFLKERDVEIATGQVTTQVDRETTSSSTGTGFMGMTSSGGATKETVTAKVMTKIKEYHWRVEVSYSIVIFAGSDPNSTDGVVELQSRSSSSVIVTSGGQAAGSFRPGVVPSKPAPPVPDATDHPPVDTDVTWFFRMIQPTEQTCEFKIDRSPTSSKKKSQHHGGGGSGNGNGCKTPRRNDDVDAAYEFNKNWLDWNLITQGFFVQRVEREILAKHDPVEKDKPGGGAGAAKMDPMAPDTIEPGTRGIITGLQKEPSFNGKRVTICEYSSQQHRYRVEPVDKSSGLPGTLLIKPQNLKLAQTAPTTSQTGGPPLSSISDASLFCPVVPLMENKTVLSMADVGDFLTEQCRTLDEAIEGLTKTYAPRQLVRLVSVAEATIVLLCQHVQDLTTSYQDAVDYVENMLKQQLVTAIGKEIQSKDFDQFMVFHNQRLFGEEYAPKPFTFAIRRPGHYPDGILAIENRTSSAGNHTRQCQLKPDDPQQPIQTWVRHVPGATAPPMLIPLSAATTIEITGDRYLHGWMQHRFRTKPKNEYQIVARARQFSSFILVIGTMLGPNQFDPKDAIILQNKDEVLIPLLTSTLPSAKEFKDSIASLSPEQQAFAKSFRKMQLESSVFGVCVIQLKPQLEKLLGLPDGALTKEIQLTQDLMSLFVDYQIPSDLMSFDGDPSDSDTSTKVTAVKGYVKSILDVIENAKEKQLIEEERKADMRAEMAHAAPGSGSALVGGGPAGFGGGVPYGAMAAMAAPQLEMADADTVLADNSEKSSSRRLNRSRKMMSPRPSASNKVVLPSKSPSSKRSLSSTATPSAQVTVETVQPLSSSTHGGESAETTSDGDTVSAEDFTMIPKILDACIDKFDTDNALRSTIIKTGPTWTLARQTNLLTPIASSTISGKAIEDEKKKAFDLMDAISRSGVLPIACSELHVVVGVSHCFDNDVVGSIVQDNVNPIEKVERSGIVIASTVHSQPAKAIVRGDEPTLLRRLTASFPLLLEADASPVEIYDDRD